MEVGLYESIIRLINIILSVVERTNRCRAQKSLSFVFLFLLFGFGRVAEEPEGAEANWNVEDVKDESLSWHKNVIDVGALEIDVQNTDFWDWLEYISYDYSKNVEKNTKIDD